ncbi:hypothetical protein SNE40_000203 [Patella caerulea]|uniref:Uncharacterized protein n=1 Tax=Patella caerulea TaxID=87958 RepID=A0AAN8KJ31_PATCE
MVYLSSGIRRYSLSDHLWPLDLPSVICPAWFYITRGGGGTDVTDGSFLNIDTLRPQRSVRSRLSRNITINRLTRYLPTDNISYSNNNNMFLYVTPVFNWAGSGCTKRRGRADPEKKAHLQKKLDKRLGDLSSKRLPKKSSNK